MWFSGYSRLVHFILFLVCIKINTEFDVGVFLIKLCANAASVLRPLQYYALQILETVIKTRWKILPRHQCEGKLDLIYLCCLQRTIVLPVSSDAQ